MASPDPSGRPVFVSWVNRRGRSSGLAAALGAVEVTVSGGRGPAPLRWLRAARVTAEALRRHRPRVTLVMQPPAMLLWLAALDAWRRGTAIVGDLHTGAFTDAKWRWSAPSTLWLLRRLGIAVVTNDDLASRVAVRGGEALIVHDLIAELPDPVGGFDDRRLEEQLREPFVLVPLAYAADEPVAAVLDAARRSGVRWILTGDASAAVRRSAPPSVRFTGFLTDEDYVRVRVRAAVVVAATVDESTMQRAGYEALSAGRPLVTTSTLVLREYFGSAAVLVAPDADGLADGVARALAARDDYGRRMRALRDRKVAEQVEQIDRLRRWIEAASVRDAAPSAVRAG